MSEWMTTDTPWGKELLTSLEPGDRIELWRRAREPEVCVVVVLHGQRMARLPSTELFCLDHDADAWSRYRIRRAT